MDIKMVALDLDGTTLNTEKKINARTVRAIEAAADIGTEIVVSTGRAINAVPDEIKKADYIRYAITSNGACIRDLRKNKRIYSDFLDKRAVHYVLDLAEREGLLIEVFTGDQAYIERSAYDYIYEHGSSYRGREYVISSRKPIDGIVDFARTHSDEIENINLFFEDLDRLAEVRPEIEAAPHSTITSSFPNNVEVGGEHTSKKRALVYLMDKLGIRQSELMCCGDAPNDMQMIEFAGVGVAMGNAWDEVKNAADFVTDDNDHDGVGRAIEKFVLKKNKY